VESQYTGVIETTNIFNYGKNSNSDKRNGPGSISRSAFMRRLTASELKMPPLEIGQKKAAENVKLLSMTESRDGRILTVVIERY